MRYLSGVWRLLKVALSRVPMPWMTAMIETEIPAAISPYSMAVAAVSSLTKRITRFDIFSFIVAPLGCLSGTGVLVALDGVGWSETVTGAYAGAIASRLIDSNRDKVLDWAYPVVNKKFSQVISG